ncbi:MAG: hypothetical protein ACYS29_00090 [Planctomycetota bacterium]|jgi:hypothetical protein
MFTANQYKIVFKRVWHDHNDVLDICHNNHCDGRYDTKCEIWLDSRPNATLPAFIGIARLHPNDKPDKIVGKKIALRNAIGYVVRAVTTDGEIMYDYNCANFYNKDVRTAIWKAFWTWVLHWGLPENRRICFIRRINDAIK